MMRRLGLFLVFLFLWTVPLQAEEIYFYHLEEEALAQINAFRASWPSETAPVCLQSLMLSPLKLSFLLNQAAQEFLRRAVEERVFSHVLPDGSSPQSRVEEQGYTPLFVGESLAYLGFENYLPPEKALEIVLGWLLENAPDQQVPESAPFVFPAYRDFGMAMAGVTISLEGKTYNFYLFCFLFAVPIEDEGAFILGRFYDDRDQNGLPTPEEGLALVPITFSSLETEETVETCTLADGSFFVPSRSSGLLEIGAPAEDLSFPRLELLSPAPLFVRVPTPKLWLNLANGGQN